MITEALSASMPDGDEITLYWDEFYAARQGALRLPSQFAAFVLSEIDEERVIVDCGCGNGRDSFFFEYFGRTVVGLDGSRSAVKDCKSFAAAKRCSRIDFHVLDFNDGKAADIYALDLRKTLAAPAVVYARFFLHAITDEASDNFFRFADILTSGGGMLAVEFRTTRDSQQPKTTSVHYRKFIDPFKFARALHHFGFSIVYYVEGVGMAKRFSDDAYVGRALVRNV